MNIEIGKISDSHKPKTILDVFNELYPDTIKSKKVDFLKFVVQNWDWFNIVVTYSL